MKKQLFFLLFISFFIISCDDEEEFKAPLLIDDVVGTYSYNDGTYHASVTKIAEQELAIKFPVNSPFTDTTMNTEKWGMEISDFSDLGSHDLNDDWITFHCTTEGMIKMQYYKSALKGFDANTGNVYQFVKED